MVYKVKYAFRISISHCSCKERVFCHHLIDSAKIPTHSSNGMCSSGPV